MCVVLYQSITNEGQQAVCTGACEAVVMLFNVVYWWE
jgi:hypothetical protein